MSEKKVVYQLPGEPQKHETIGQKRFRTLKLMSYLDYHNPKTTKDLDRVLLTFSEEQELGFDVLVNELMMYGVKYLIMKFDEELKK